MLKGCFNCRNKHDCEVKSQCIHITTEGIDLWNPTVELFEQLEKKIEKLERTIKHLERRLKDEKEEHEMTLNILIEDYEKLLEKKNG